MAPNKKDPTSPTTKRLPSFDIAALLLGIVCSEKRPKEEPSNGSSAETPAAVSNDQTDTHADTPPHIDQVEYDTDMQDVEEIARLLGLNHPSTTMPIYTTSASTPAEPEHVPARGRSVTTTAQSTKRKRRQRTTSPNTADGVISDDETANRPNRRQRRLRSRTAQKQVDGYLARQSSPLLDYVRKHADVLVSSIPLAALPTDSSGYTALNEKAGARKEAPLPGPMPTALKDFLDRGFTVLPAKNDGGATCLTDAHDRVFAVREEFSINGWDEAVQRAHATIRSEWPNVADGRNVWDSHRGVSSHNFGCYHGNGMTNMSWMEGEFTDVVQRLRENPDLRRIAAQVSAALSKWFPRIYADALRRVLLITDTLGFPRTFPTSVFTTLAVNFGPQAATIKHRDWTDKAGEMCAVQALGHYDHTKGGHLVLWDLKLLIEFPPGSLILFPSAVLAHSNVTIQEGEERTSLVHYTPGNVCRFVDNGFQTESHYKKHNKGKYNSIVAAKLTRWKRGLEKLSTVKDLRGAV